MRLKSTDIIWVLFWVFGLSFSALAQDIVRELRLAEGAAVDIVNHHGRVSAFAGPFENGKTTPGKLTASSPAGVVDSEIRITSNGNRTAIEVVTRDDRKRIDITLTLPERSQIKADTLAGAIDVAGNIAVLDAKTATGTIVLDIPTDDITYQFFWTESRPRYVADFELSPVRERAAGRFEIKGHYSDNGEVKSKKPKGKNGDDDPDVPDADGKDPKGNDPNKRPAGKGPVSLNLTTARGIILLNVPPSEVGSDLRERPLTEAAKAIVRSGDSLLMEAIRRSAPKYYGDYTRSLPPYKREPAFTQKVKPENLGVAQLKQALVRVTDLQNRSIAGLTVKDFEVTESGTAREIVSVEQSTAPFNLVLLLDVSGSVENYVNFIRKAARNFVETVDKNDRVSIVIFNEDVKVLSKFTTDKGKLSTSLDTFDAGGGTAYYDALAYTVADTLRPLKGDRTAIVILTDGDDNRSFLPFDSLMGSIQESGALIYPLYVPSGLIALAEQKKNVDIDPMRRKYMSLTAKSEGEGEKLAKVSGGVYYSITQISQIQQAYEDIVLQLRTAYNITYRSTTPADGVSPRLRVKAKRENSYSSVTSLKAVN